MDAGTGARGLQNSGKFQSWNFSMGIKRFKLKFAKFGLAYNGGKKTIAENFYSVLNIPLSHAQIISIILHTAAGLLEPQ